MLVQYIPSSCVCVSVKRWYYIKTTKSRIMLTMPYDSPVIRITKLYNSVICCEWEMTVAGSFCDCELSIGTEESNSTDRPFTSWSLKMISRSPVLHGWLTLLLTTHTIHTHTHTGTGAAGTCRKNIRYSHFLYTYNSQNVRYYQVS